MKKKALALLLFAAAIALAASCGIASAATRPADELVVLMGADASTFDSHKCTDANTEAMKVNLYSNLVRYDENLKVQPDLAKRWELADDGVTWTFHLRDDVTFHDGTKFNAEAVKVNFERALSKETGSPRRYVIEKIDRVEVVDDYTVKVITSVPNGSMLQQLCHHVGEIMSPAALEKYGKDIATHPVGTGPFKFTEWVVGDRIVFERFDDYFEGPAKMKRVVYRIVPDDNIRSMLLQSGEGDIATRLPVQDIVRLRNNDKIKFLERDSLMNMYVAINCSKGPLKDVRVRQALNYAIDKQLIIDEVLNGMSTLGDCPISSVTWGYHPIMTYQPDVKKAKELLKEAGYPDGLNLSIWTPVGRYQMDTQVCEVMQAMWAEAGINVEIRQWEFQALMEAVKKGGFDMVYLGWSPATGEANHGLFPVLHSSQWPPNSNRAHYANDKLDNLLVTAQTEMNEEKRLALYEQAERHIMEDAPWVFLYYAKNSYATGLDISGVTVMATEALIFKDVERTK